MPGKHVLPDLLANQDIRITPEFHSVVWPTQPQEASVAAPATLLSAALSDEQLSYVITNWKNKNRSYALLTLQTMLTLISSKLWKIFFAKAGEDANTSVFPPVAVPAIISSLED